MSKVTINQNDNLATLKVIKDKQHYRMCNQCFKGMNEGYLIDSCNTVCSEDCARSFIGSDNFDVEMSIWELEGDNNYIYWTTWQE